MWHWLIDSLLTHQRHIDQSFDDLFLWMSLQMFVQVHANVQIKRTNRTLCSRLHVCLCGLVLFRLYMTKLRINFLRFAQFHQFVFVVEPPYNESDETRNKKILCTPIISLLIS